MISKSFLKSSLLYTITSSLPMLGGLILLPFYTNLLSTSQYGSLVLYISFTLLIQVLFNLGLDETLRIYFYKYKGRPDKLASFMSSLFLLLIIIGLIIIPLFFIGGNYLFQLLFKGDNLSFFPFGLMSVVTAFCNAFFKSYTYILIHQQRQGLFSILNITNFVLTIAISLIGLYLDPFSLNGPMWGRLLSGFAILFLACYFGFKDFGFHFKKHYVRLFLILGLPTFIFIILSWAGSNLDRFILNNYLTKIDVGIYDFSLRLVTIIEVVLTGLSFTIYPKIYSLWTEQKITHSTDEVNRYFYTFSALSLILAIITIVVMPLLVPLIITNKELYAAFKYLPLLSLSFISRGVYSLYITPIYFLKRTRVLPKIFLFSSIVQIVVTILMIKYWGLMGAAWAVFLTRPISVIFIALESKTVFTFKYNQVKMIWLPLLVSAIILIGEYVFKTDQNFIYVTLVELAFTCGIVFWVYKAPLMKIANIYFKKYFPGKVIKIRQ